MAASLTIEFILKDNASSNIIICLESNGVVTDQLGLSKCFDTYCFTLHIFKGHFQWVFHLIILDIPSLSMWCREFCNTSTHTSIQTRSSPLVDSIVVKLSCQSLRIPEGLIIGQDEYGEQNGPGLPYHPEFWKF